MKSIDSEDSFALVETFEVLIKRKEDLYPDVKRLVLDCKVQDAPMGFHVDVASTL